MKIGIIGAGVAGLASAVRLAGRGHEVQVFEASATPGGKLAELQLGDFRFDAGPSLFTMPQYVDELFEAAGEEAGQHFRYLRLPELCRYFWEDGTRLSTWAEPGAFAAEVESVLGVSKEKVLDMLRDSRFKYEMTGWIFLEKSLHRLSTWLSPAVAKAMLRIPSFDLLTTMNNVHERRLGHPKLVQLFNRYATYNGSNPFKAPGLLTIIPHFEYGFGAFYPEGGMYAITKALYALALRKGVQFHFQSPVSRIIVEQGRAKALQLGGETIAFDRVVSNMDVFHTYRKLLPDQVHPERILKQEKSTSALIFYWGIGAAFPELDLHNIFFSEQYQTEFSHLARGEVYHDPTVYINITSKYSPEDAPAGMENWFTMVNVPFNSGQDWDALIRRVRGDILSKLSRVLGREIEPLIREEAVLDPRTIESKTSSHLGALYGTSSNNRLAAFLRHPNFSGRIRDLYFCGGSVHPGGGLPLCLLSAKIVDELMHASPNN